MNSSSLEGRVAITCIKVSLISRASRAVSRFRHALSKETAQHQKRPTRRAVKRRLTTNTKAAMPLRPSASALKPNSETQIRSFSLEAIRHLHHVAVRPIERHSAFVESNSAENEFAKLPVEIGSVAIGQTRNRYQRVERIAEIRVASPAATGIRPRTSVQFPPRRGLRYPAGDTQPVFRVEKWQFIALPCREQTGNIQVILRPRYAYNPARRRAWVASAPRWERP